MEIPIKTSYTAEDYERLPEGAPYQLIEGQLIMSPAPAPFHQMILGRLYIMLHRFVEQHNLGTVFLSPIDVYLSNVNAFQPDLIFIAKKNHDILKPRHVQGPPRSRRRDSIAVDGLLHLKQKKRGYQSAGVKEYWVVDPEDKSMEEYGLDEDSFDLLDQAAGEGETGSEILAGLRVDVVAIFRPIL